MAMKRVEILCVALALGTALSAGADDVLDAKLDALKKKSAARRSYTTPALLNDQNLVVPKAATDEEKALDEKLRAMDKKLDKGPSMLARPLSPRPAIARPAQDEPVNWLTPALFDDSAAENNSSEEAADSWVTLELARQKNILLEKAAREEEEALADQRLRGEIPSGAPAPYDPLQGYNTALPNMTSGILDSPANRRAAPNDSAIIYRRPQTTVPNALNSTPDSSSALSGSWQPRRTVQEAPSSSTLPTLSQPFGKTKSPTPSRLSPSWTTPEAEKPAPSKRPRRTLPALQSNPFDDDFMPTVKKSIWD